MIAATDVADLLVRLGVPFREAHGVVAGLVRTASTAAGACRSSTAEELAAHSASCSTHSTSTTHVLAQSSWLESKVSEGGTALARVSRAARARAAVAVLDGGARA